MSVPTIGGVRLVTSDHVCTAVQDALEAHLPAWVTAAGLKQVNTWEQRPDATEIAAANLPAGAIGSPGLAKPPVLNRGGAGKRRTWDATFRVGVAVYDRGSDHAQTAHRARTWAGLLRTVLDQHGDLGGLARSTTWVGEDYGTAGRGDRTFGQGVVAFDVEVPDVIPATGPANAPTPLGPLVLTATPTLTPRAR